MDEITYGCGALLEYVDMNTKYSGGGNLSPCHFVYHTSHMVCLGIEPVPIW